MTSKYGDIIKVARDPKAKKAEAPAEQVSKWQEALTEPEPEVNLCVKVPLTLRRHWAAEAKRQGVTMTAIIVEALKARFGESD